MSLQIILFKQVIQHSETDYYNYIDRRIVVYIAAEKQD